MEQSEGVSVGQGQFQSEACWPVVERADGPDPLKRRCMGRVERVRATWGLGDHGKNLDVFSKFDGKLFGGLE